MDQTSGRRGRLGTFFRWIFGPFFRLFRRGKKSKTTGKGGAQARGRAESSEKTADSSEDAASVWTPERLNILEKLWGEGCISPTSASFLQLMVPLLALSEKKSLLLLGAGLGGLGRAMVEETGVWVTGYEAEPVLAELAKDFTKMAGMQKRAPVSLCNFEKAKFKESSFNTVVSMESLYKVADKEQLYTAMAAAMRVEGEMMMIDFVVPDGGPLNQAVSDWCERKSSPPHLWQAGKIQSFLSTLNLDVRPFQDITAEYRAGVFKGFFGYLANVTKAELLETSGELIAECEFWAKQLSAIDSGGLKVFRFHAFKLPEKRKSMI